MLNVERFGVAKLCCACQLFLVVYSTEYYVRNPVKGTVTASLCFLFFKVKYGRCVDATEDVLDTELLHYY